MQRRLEMSRILFVLVLSLSFAEASFAGMYKWVDEDGNVHYGDCPPADCKPEQIEAVPAPSQEDAQRSRERTERLIKEQKSKEGARRSDINGDGFETLLRHIGAVKPYETKMKEFVQLATNGETSLLMALVSPNAIRSNGPQKIREILKNEIIPFFSSYQKLHNVKSINPATDPGGNVVGYWIDTYIVTSKGDVRPFSIVIIEEGGRLVVSDVIVNKCRKDRHPFCP